MIRWFGPIRINAMILFTGAWLATWWRRRHPAYCADHGDVCPANYRCLRWADGECDGHAERTN